ncbi:hypothetical protein GN956_G11537 [Arapaima gigas]
MEPDMTCMCSCSPPPMDKGAKEGDDEFGDFGGFTTGQPCGTDASPLSFGGLTKATGDVVYKLSSSKLRDISHGFSLARRGSDTEDLKGSADHPCSTAGCKSAAPEVHRCRTEGKTCGCDGGTMVTGVLNGLEDNWNSAPPAVAPSPDWHPPVAVDTSARAVVSSQTCLPWPADNHSSPAMGEEALSNGCWDGIASLEDGNGLRVEELTLVANGECGMQRSGSTHTVSTSTSGDFASFCEAVYPDNQEAFGPEGTGSEEVGSVDVNRTQSAIQDDSAGDFDSLKHCDQEEGADGCRSQSGDFTSSDSFADFHSAPLDLDAVTDWDAFGGQGGDHSWPASRSEHVAAYSEQWQDGIVTSLSCGSPFTCRRDSLSVSPSSCLESLFQASFPLEPTTEAQEEVLALWMELKEDGAEQDVGGHRTQRDIWWQLQDIQSVVGLKHRWPGSHSNKALLSSLGIDTQNIVLQPTKESQHPLSEAEKVASVAQRLPGSPEVSCPEPNQQEVLPPVQFNWSNSGLTDPLDVHPRFLSCPSVGLHLGPSAAVCLEP